jgi:hypothetical protein
VLIWNINDTKNVQTPLAAGWAKRYVWTRQANPTFPGDLAIWSKVGLQKLTRRKQLTFTADAQQSLAFERMLSLKQTAARWLQRSTACTFVTKQQPEGCAPSTLVQ